MSAPVPGRIAVTGCHGFIGQHLTSELRAAGYVVRGLSRSAATHPDDRQIPYDTTGFERSLKGMDSVIHLAGRRMTRQDAPFDIAPFLAPNVKMVGDLAAACRASGVTRIVLASTIAVYMGGAQAPYSEQTLPRPLNAYALSKLMAEACLEMACRDGDCSALSLRIAATHGAGEKGTPVLMRFIDRAVRGERLVLTGNPNFRIDQIYVGDLTRAFIAAIEQGEVQGVLNIGGGRGIALEEMAKTVNDVFAQPNKLEMDFTDTQPVPDAHMDISQASDLLGWRPLFSLREGLADMRAALPGAFS